MLCFRVNAAKVSCCNTFDPNSNRLLLKVLGLASLVVQVVELDSYKKPRQQEKLLGLWVIFILLDAD